MSDLISRQAAGMTKDLAIRILTGDVIGTSEQTQEAVTMAVKALSELDVTDTNVGDISGYCDRLWRNAYERGKLDAQAEIIRCKDCRWRIDQSGTTAWLPCRALVTPSEFYCCQAERRQDSKRRC